MTEVNYSKSTVEERLTGCAHRLAVGVKEEGTQATLGFDQLGEQWHHIPSGYLNFSRHSINFH